MKQVRYQSPADRQRRINRCARALEYGQNEKSMLKIYTSVEVEEAKKLVKRFKKTG